MTRLRELWQLLCEALSGRLLRRVVTLENELHRQDRWHARWEQETVKLDHYAKSKTQALSREVGAIKMDMVKLSIAAVDAGQAREIEAEMTLDDDFEELTVILRSEDDGKI